MKQGMLVLCLLWSAILTHAQNAESKQPSTAKAAAPNAAAPSEAAALELKERRARARSLLVALSTDARSFHDQTLRARSLARIADALWQVDAEQARLLFRKAWEAAEVADQESDRKLQEEISQQKARTGGGYALTLPPNIRREVLKLAARRDRALGEEFLEKLQAQSLEKATSGTSTRSNDAASQRIGLARELLQAGDTERAFQFAGTALTNVTRESVDFLVSLREKDPAKADTGYGAMLAGATINPQSDANTVSLLSSYIYTPHLYITFTGNGTSTSQSSSTITPVEVAPGLRQAFFQTAAGILLRPLPAPGQPDQTTAGVDGKYLVIKRLLPLFEQSAPAEMAEALRGHLNALNAIVSDNTRRRDDEWLSAGIGSKSDKPAVNREQQLLDRIERAKTSAQRDALYIELAMVMANKADLKARDYVSKVEDTELRKQAQVYVDTSLAMNFVQKKLTDEAVEMVHKGELGRLHKVWVLTECAKILSKTDRDKAMQLIEEASDEAARIDGSDPARPRALLALANALKVTDPARVWDATFDAVKAANSAEGFSGEDGELVIQFQSKGQSSVHSSDVSEFDLEGIFKDLATQDYDRAVEMARGFQAEGPRAVATIAIARAILEPKRK